MWSLGEMLVFPFGLAQAADAAPDQLRGRYQGAYSMSFATGRMLAPVVGTVLFSAGEAWLWTACAVLGAVSAVLLLRGVSGPPVQVVRTPSTRSRTG